MCHEYPIVLRQKLTFEHVRSPGLDFKGFMAPEYILGLPDCDSTGLPLADVYCGRDDYLSVSPVKPHLKDVLSKNQIGIF